MDYKYDMSEEKGSKKVFDVEVPKEEVDSKYTEVLKMLRKEAKVPGFRPGKVPLNVIKSRFGKDVLGEVGEQLIQESMSNAVKDSGISPISSPEILDLQLEEGKPLIFKASVEVAPDIKLEKTEGFTIKKQDEKITDKDVEQAFEAIKDMESTLEESDQPAEVGNVLTVDLFKLEDPDNRLPQDEFKDFTVELSEETSLPEFISELKGTLPGDEREVKVTYPPDYDEKRLAGATIKFKVVVKTIKKKTPPEMDESFFGKFAQDVKTVDEFKEKLRLDLVARREKEIQEDMREQVVKSVIMHNQFEMPDSLLNRYLDDVVEDFRQEHPNDPVDEDEIREKYRPVGIRMIRWNLLMHKIAEEKDIKVEKDDIDKWIESFADRYNMEFEQAKQMLEASKKVQQVRETVLEAKVLSYLLDNSEVVDA